MRFERHAGGGALSECQLCGWNSEGQCGCGCCGCGAGFCGVFGALDGMDGVRD